MTHNIPQPVLDVIRTYCKQDVGNVMPIIEHAIHYCVGGNPVRVNKYAELLCRAIQNDIDPDLLKLLS